MAACLQDHKKLGSTPAACLDPLAILETADVLTFCPTVSMTIWATWKHWNWGGGRNPQVTPTLITLATDFGSVLLKSRLDKVQVQEVSVASAVGRCCVLGEIVRGGSCQSGETSVALETMDEMQAYFLV